MKTLIKLFFVAVLVIGCMGIANAQNTKKDKEAAKAAKIASIIDARNYVFVANYAIPQRGGAKSLTYGYDVIVSKDTIISYLPYYGRAYTAQIGQTDGGIKFTSTNFTYDAKQSKKGGYDIVITPKEMNSSEAIKDVRYMRLSVSSNGYATLQVTANNRDPITFNGNIEERKTKK